MTESGSWTDLTVPQASDLRDFYAGIMGWRAEPVDMGGYEDFVMKDERGTVCGICHARGPNTGIPPVWLPYFRVASLQASLESCELRGGRIVRAPQDCGPEMRIAVIQDPAGAFAALFEAVESTAPDR